MLANDSSNDVDYEKMVVINSVKQGSKVVIFVDFKNPGIIDRVFEQTLVV